MSTPSPRNAPPKAAWDPELAPPEASDPGLEAYQKDIDRTLLRENLKLTPEERAQKFLSILKFAAEMREAGRSARTGDPHWGLDRLIQLKRAAGRPKDLEAIAELQVLLEERRKQGGAG